MTDKGLEEIEKDNKKLVTPYGIATIDGKGFYILPNGEKLYKVLYEDLKGKVKE